MFIKYVFDYYFAPAPALQRTSAVQRWAGNSLRALLFFFFFLTEINVKTY